MDLLPEIRRRVSELEDYINDVYNGYYGHRTQSEKADLNTMRCLQQHFIDHPSSPIYY